MLLHDSHNPFFRQPAGPVPAGSTVVIRFQSDEASAVILRTWMKELRAKSVRTPTEELLLSAEGGGIDFSDEADLAPIVHAARFGKEAEA